MVLPPLGGNDRDDNSLKPIWEIRWAESIGSFLGDLRKISPERLVAAKV
jgi:hypothetical protein